MTYFLISFLACKKDGTDITGSNESFEGTTVITIYNYDPVIYQVFKDGASHITIGAAKGTGDFTRVSITFTDSFTSIGGPGNSKSHSVDIRRNQDIFDVLNATTISNSEKNITICIQYGQFVSQSDLKF